MVCDTSFADDLLLTTMCQDNSSAIAKARVMFEITYRKFAQYALPLNLKPGKSAVMISAKGKGAPKIEYQLFNDMDFALDVYLHDGNKKVHIAIAYKHLGSWVQADRALYKEFKFRSSIAKGSATTLAKVFRRPGVTTQSKTNLSISIPYSQFYFSKHVASDTNATLSKGYDAAHMTIA